MVGQYLKFAGKTLARNKYYTLINVVGLTCGMLSALIIAKYIGYSMQFDSFHEMKDRIHSITQHETLDGNPQPDRTATYWGVGELVDQFPEIADMTRYGLHVESLVMTDDEIGNRISFLEKHIFIADSNFLRIFTFPLIEGNPETVLSRPNSVIITRTTAQRYFGHTNPIGKTLTIRVSWAQETTYEVTGVLEDIPGLSQFRFDFLVASQPRSGTEDMWAVPNQSTFVLLKEGASIDELNDKLNNSLNHVEELNATNRKVTASLRSITKSQLSTTEYLLAAVGIFIVVICWINYINQIIAQCYWRIKQVGILRVIGATRINLTAQFITESGLVCVTSLILVIGSYVILEESLQTLTNGHLLPLVADPTLINFVFIVIFISGVIAASAVPAAILFSQHLGTTLRNVHSTRMGSIGLRRALVVVQFSISTILVISIFVITGQLEFLSTKDKGITMENILVVKAPMVKDTTWNVKRKTLELLKSQFAELPFVAGVTSSTTVPGEEYRHETYLSLEDRTHKFLVHQNGVDENFLRLYKVEFVAGHDFIPNARARNRTSIILNESAARGLGIYDFDKMTDSKIVDQESGEAYDLIGIIKDYHQTPLKFEIEPLAFRLNEFRGHISLKINGSDVEFNAIKDKLPAIKQIWNQVYNDAAFDYYFLPANYEARNMQDRYFGRLFKWFTLLSILISCLGLFGMSLLISAKRQREIGVRRVFGASAVDILAMFLKGYLTSLISSVAIGLPVAYLLMKAWLNDYAYRIEIGMGLLATPILCLCIIFLFTVSYHTIKSSLADPVKILRD